MQKMQGKIRPMPRHWPDHANLIGYRVIALCAEAEAGAAPGNTTTRVPTVTRL
jgi:hypothetical protein